MELRNKPEGLQLWTGVEQNEGPQSTVTTDTSGSPHSKFMTVTLYKTNLVLHQTDTTYPARILLMKVCGKKIMGSTPWDRT